MKKILSNIYLLAALFMIGAAITSCSKSDDTPAPEPKPVGPTTYTMTIKATKGGDAKTRALTPDGSAINATWTEGDVVVVYEGETELGTLKAQDLTDGNTKCTLKGTNIQAPTGSSVTLKYQGNPNYSSQGGTIAYISANCDYAKADVEVTVDKDKKRITGSGADFVNQQAIVKFTLKEGEALLSPGALKVHFSSTTEPANIVTVTLSDISSIYSTNGNGVVYVAIPGATYNVTLNATMENTFYTDTYSYTKTGATFANNYYAITVKMVKNFNPYKTPLTLENCYDGTNRISVSNYYELEYSINGSAWASFDGEESLDKRGDKISFRGTKVTRNNYIGSTLTTIASDYGCYVYGNIMSLIYPTNFASKTSLNYDEKEDTDNRTFEKLFISSKLRHKEGKDLVLPATELTVDCYKWMFYESKLLEQAPELPATNVPSGAYNAMFFGCNSLNYVKCLAKEFSDNTCTTEWLNGVAATGTFVVNSSLYIDPEHPTTSPVKDSQGDTVWERNYSGILSGWTVTKE